MSKTIQPFVIENFASYFRDAESYSKFVAALEEACSSTTTPFISHGKILGITISTEFGKEILAKRLVERWTQDPGQIDRLIESMKEEGVSADDILK